MTASAVHTGSGEDLRPGGRPLATDDATLYLVDWQAITVYRRNGFAESSTRPPTLSMDGAIVMERSLSVASRCA